MGRLPHLLAEAAAGRIAPAASAARGSCPAATRASGRRSARSAASRVAVIAKGRGHGPSSNADEYGEYQGEYLLLDHERGTVGCYAAVCCTKTD